MRTSPSRRYLLQSLGISNRLAEAASRYEHKPPSDSMGVSIRNGGSEVLIYGTIGFDWSGDGLTAEALHQQLEALDAPEIAVRINSPGGDVFDGLAIYNQLSRHPSKIAVEVDGQAVSAASVVAMAGDTVRMGEGAQMMIHNAYAGVIGDAAELRAFADVLASISGELAGIYAKRSGRPVAEHVAQMAAETWFTGPEAVRMGLADSAAGGDFQADRVQQGAAARLRRERRNRNA